MLSCSVEALEQALVRFSEERLTYKRVAEAVAAELQETCDKASLPCRVSGREKDVRSYHTKVITKGYADPWADVTDKAGARVILESAGDVDRACEVLQAALGSRVLRLEDKRNVSSPDRLGYSGVHLQIRAELDGEFYECEVQLRTAAQDLWATMSHKALYKPYVELSPDIQHAAYRLVAIVELFDEELQRISTHMRSEEDDLASRIIPIVEGSFLALAHAPSNRQLGKQILDAIAPAFEAHEVDNYAEILAAYVAAEGEGLANVYREYGPHSAVAYLPDYLLFSQAESLAVIERLSSRKHALADAWRRSGLPWSYLVALAAATGLLLPDVDM